jgi:hypothetical protein
MRLLRYVIIFGLFIYSATCFASDPEGCMECHRLELVSMGEKKVIKPIYIDEESFKLSKHGDMYCSDCHSDAVQFPHRTTPETVSCLERCHGKSGEDEEQKIHMEKYYAYQEDVHFLLKYDCKECHTEFSSMNRLNASLMCLTCHREGEREGKEIVFSTPVHGKLTGPGAIVFCVDCHTPHGLKPEGSPERLAERNCYRGVDCHGENITDKIYLGGHIQKKGGGIFIKIVQFFLQMLCVFFVILGSMIVCKRKEEDFGKENHS